MNFLKSPAANKPVNSKLPIHESKLSDQMLFMLAEFLKPEFSQSLSFRNQLNTPCKSIVEWNRNQAYSEVIEQ